MRRSVVFLVGVVLVGVVPAGPSEAAEGESSLTAWVLEGEVMVDGSEKLARVYRELPCPEIHTAIDDYNAGRLRVTPPPTDWEPADQIEHYDLTRLELVSLSEATTFDKEDIVNCSSRQPGWLPARAGDVGQVTVVDGPLVRVVEGGPPGCGSGQVVMVGSEFVWDWVRGRWSYGYGRNWRSTEDLMTPGVVGASTFVFSCLSVFAVGSDFAGVASLVPSVQVNHNPRVRSLVRLDVWLWYDFSDRSSYALGPLTVSVNEYGRDWVLVVDAWVDRVWWNPVCTTSCDLRSTLVEADVSEWEDLGLVLDLDDTEVSPPQTLDGGFESEVGAVEVFRYRTKGWYRFSVATVWRGAYSFNGVVYAYDPVFVSNGEDFQVTEVRVRLTTPNP